MSKYRLSYKIYGGYKDIDLSMLDCLDDFKETDLSVIDKFTANFNNMDELISFLKRNGVITDSSVEVLYITIDKKVDGKIINKKIYGGNNLLFKSDYNYLSVSFIYKWLVRNKYNFDAIISICDNYIEKYQNAYNRIDASSHILSLFSSLKRLASGIKNNILEDTPSVYLEYQKCIDDFFSLEFFKIDKEILHKEGKIVKRQTIGGKALKQYRNIHDFIILLKSLDDNLELYISDKLVDENDILAENNERKILRYQDNTSFDEEHDEFLEAQDFANVFNYCGENFKPERDGNDYIIPTPKIESEDIKKLILKPGDGYRK